ncbi:MAG: hypothetical protein ORN54_08645 [Cyclobacteriaceae bacterium]|nr:hypothetical protein [Cyclobacteriaceae bacterium]
MTSYNLLRSIKVITLRGDQCAHLINNGTKSHQNITPEIFSDTKVAIKVAIGKNRKIFFLNGVIRGALNKPGTKFYQ